MKILANKLDDWNKCCEVNSKDAYSNATVQFAKRWAEMMEKEIEDGKNVYDIAEKTSLDADTDGITGFMYGCAVNILSQLWAYGEDLRKWHNRQYGIADDCKGCVNPAILTVNV